MSDRPDFGGLAELVCLCSLDQTPLFPAVMIGGAALIGPLLCALGKPCHDGAQHPGAPLLHIMGNGVAFRLFQYVCETDTSDGLWVNPVESICSMKLDSAEGAILVHPDYTVCAAAPATASSATWRAGCAASGTPARLEGLRPVRRVRR